MTAAPPDASWDSAVRRSETRPGFADPDRFAVFGALAERFTALELLDPDPPRQPGFFLRGLRSLPVRLRGR